jgi:uncharacterized protein YdhG (YjbR/CyaY superfamily)
VATGTVENGGERGDRARYFPAIERTHGRPIREWFDLLAAAGPASYDAQMALLRDGHGFSRTHANAVVMTHRGSPSARRVASPEAWFAALPPDHARTARAIFAAITDRHPDLDLVIAWNQPILRTAAGYVFGMSAATRHLTCNPFSTEVLQAHASLLTGCTVNARTFSVPIGWPVDAPLLDRMVVARLVELA